MMNIQILPLSPPREQIEEQEVEEKKKVKFCLPNIQVDKEEGEKQENKEDEKEEVCSPNIDIHAHIVPDTILVALLNRDQEMYELVKHNQPFFNAIQLQLGKKEWQSLEKILYSSRQQLNDSQWIYKIGKCLNRIPTSLNTFKDLVGYMNIEDEDHTDINNEPTFFQHINVCHIRQYPERLKDFKSSYPQFFINCQQVLSKQAMATLESTLFTPRSSLSDQQWKCIINQILSCHQNLMDQLKEIIAYEINDDDS